MWSLIHELRISVLFPLIVLLAIWNRRVTIVALASLWLVGEAAGCFTQEGSILASILDTAGYILFFATGAICFYHRQTLAATAGKLPLWATAIAALVLMAIPAGAPASELFYGLASVALIGAAIGHEKAQSFLPPLLICG